MKRFTNKAQWSTLQKVLLFVVVVTVVIVIFTQFMDKGTTGINKYVNGFNSDFDDGDSLGASTDQCPCEPATTKEGYALRSTTVAQKNLFKKGTQVITAQDLSAIKDYLEYDFVDELHLEYGREDLVSTTPSHSEFCIFSQTPGECTFKEFQISYLQSENSDFVRRCYFDASTCKKIQQQYDNISAYFANDRKLTTTSKK